MEILIFCENLEMIFDINLWQKAAFYDSVSNSTESSIIHKKNEDILSQCSGEITKVNKIVKGSVIKGKYVTIYICNLLVCHLNCHCLTFPKLTLSIHRHVFDGIRGFYRPGTLRERWENCLGTVGDKRNWRFKPGLRALNITLIQSFP